MRPKPAGDPSGLPVLLVDDDALYLAAIERLLRRIRLPAAGFTDPKLALRAFEATPDAFSLVITDHRMPEMSGLELAGRIHAIRERVPILVASGYVHEIDTAQARRYGVREVLAKPLTVDEFRRAVQAALGRQEASGPSPGTRSDDSFV